MCPDHSAERPAGKSFSAFIPCTYITHLETKRPADVNASRCCNPRRESKYACWRLDTKPRKQHKPADKMLAASDFVNDRTVPALLKAHNSHYFRVARTERCVLRRVNGICTFKRKEKSNAIHTSNHSVDFRSCGRNAAWCSRQEGYDKRYIPNC